MAQEADVWIYLIHCCTKYA